MTKTQPIVQPAVAHTLFERALQLLEAPNVAHNTPHSWIKGTLARNHAYIACPPESDLAVAYCELGAIQAVVYSMYPDTNRDQANNYLVSLFTMANPNVVYNGTVPAVNDDSRTEFTLIRKMFQKAIQLCERLESK